MKNSQSVGHEPTRHNQACVKCEPTKDKASPSHMLEWTDAQPREWPSASPPVTSPLTPAPSTPKTAQPEPKVSKVPDAPKTLPTNPPEDEATKGDVRDATYFRFLDV